MSPPAKMNNGNITELIWVAPSELFQQTWKLTLSTEILLDQKFQIAKSFQH